jgi:tetratricopeptide (TPR) repeat protein
MHKRVSQSTGIRNDPELRQRRSSRFSATQEDQMNRRKQFLVASGMLLLTPGLGNAHDAEKLGNVNFPISCAAGAQPAFNRALAMLHSFWFPQALNAFAEIGKAHPDCAMAFWGTAMSARTNPLLGSQPAPALQRGFDEINKAIGASAKTQRERDYIAALAVYYTDLGKGDYPARVLAYEKAMEQLAARYPDDEEAQVFYALALNEGITVAPADKTYTRHLKAAAISEKVLARNADHPGAIHYLIHSYDFPALAKRGVPAAKQYASVAPSAPHALHMPSHIYTMLGMWEESIKANRDALVVFKGYVHAIDFMVYAHLQMGQDREARQLMETSAALLKAGPSIVRTPTGGVFPSYTAWAAIPARIAIERGAWAEAAALQLTPTAPAADAITHFTRAMGFARMRDLASARAEIDALQRLKDELLGLKDVYWAEQVEIQHKAALAWLTYAEGNAAAALKLMRAAADAEDASEKSPAMENRLWPMRELLGELLLESKQPGAALKEFEKSLGQYPSRIRAFAGAAKAADAAGNRQAATEHYKKLVALTAKGDPGKREVQDAKAFLAAR